MTESADLLRLDLIINAGGESRRMGRPKALLPVPPDATPLIAHMARRLAGLPLGTVIVVTNDPGLPAQAQLPAQAIFVADAYPDTGTLGGIATGLQQINGWAIVVACDLPLVSPAVFALLAAVCRGAGCDGQPVGCHRADGGRLRGATPCPLSSPLPACDRVATGAGAATRDQLYERRAHPLCDGA